MQARFARHTDRLDDVVGFYRAYLGSPEALVEAVRRTRAHPVEPANPYWATHGVTLADPDGFCVVLVGRSWRAS